jgi:hypothetical protein
VNYKTKFFKFYFILLIVLMSNSHRLLATSSGPGITYQGLLVAPNGDPVVSSQVQFKVQIRTPGVEDCLMYEELQTQDLSKTNGSFSLSLNDGSGSRTDNAGFSLNQIFANRGTLTFAAGNCSVGYTYTPNSTASRKLLVMFNDGTLLADEWETIPSMVINYVPTAIEAMQIGGYKKEQLLKIADGVSTTGTELSVSDFANFLSLINGTSIQYPSQSSFNTLSTTVTALTSSISGGSSFLAATGGTMSGKLTVSSGGASIMGGLNNNSNGLTNAGSISGVGPNISGTSSITISAGGAVQNLNLLSATTGSVNIGSGNGTQMSVLDSGTITVDYVTIQGAKAGGTPLIGTAGTDTNINLALMPKGSGNVGIGTSSPNATLDIQGQLRTKSYVQTNGSVDFNNGNAIMTSFDCTSNISFANLLDGGSYSLVVTDASITQCNFNTTTSGNDSATLIYHYIPDNGSRVLGSHTIYSLLRVSNHVYITWSSGF